MAERIDVTVPACTLGFPKEQVEQLLAERMSDFNHWMRGQTAAICDGRIYDHEAREYRPSGCGPHGLVVYPWDVENFLSGGQIRD